METKKLSDRLAEHCCSTILTDTPAHVTQANAIITATRALENNLGATERLLESSREENRALENNLQTAIDGAAAVAHELERKALDELRAEMKALRSHRDTLQAFYDDAQAVLSNVLAHRDALEQRRGELLDALQKNKEGYRLMVNQRDAALDKLEQIRDLLD